MIEPIHIPSVIAILVCGVLLALGVDGLIKYVFAGAVLGTGGLVGVARLIRPKE